MSLQLPKAAESEIRAHAESTYPEECCGALLGRDNDDGSRTITGVLRIGNTKDEERKRRYLIDPKDLLQAEKTARAQGVDVVGIYHSHPDHPSEPSEFDRVHAMPFWSYIIVACAKGTTAKLQSWRLRDDRSKFDEEPVVA